jgi:hypothetical protein
MARFLNQGAGVLTEVPSMTTRRWLLALPFALSLLSACAGDLPQDGEADEAEPVEDATMLSEQSLTTDLTEHTATGYSHGAAFTIHVVTVDGKPVEVATAHQYLRMKAAAANAGVYLRIVSGFRTMAEQQYLYNLYREGKGNLAAVPGYSNHQSGHALDLNTSDSGVYGWLTNHGGAWGFKRTVPSEIWHWEYWGADPGPAGGAGGGMGGGGGSGASCRSATLAKSVADGVCVQAASDQAWYHCDNGAWLAGATSCTTRYAWCNSATLGRDVAPRTCVQSRADRIWYQCDKSVWASGVKDGAGPGGTCSVEHSL